MASAGFVIQAIPYLGNIETARLCYQNFTADCALMFVPGGGLARAGERTALRALREGDEAAEVGKYIGKSCATGKMSFAADTRVLMADGTTTPIKNIKPGDEVLATDPETGERAAKTVTAVWVHKDKLVDLELRAGSDKDGNPDHITTTEDHPFWNATDHQWQQAQSIKPGEPSSPQTDTSYPSPASSGLPRTKRPRTTSPSPTSTPTTCSQARCPSLPTTSTAAWWRLEILENSSPFMGLTQTTLRNFAS
ncbi:Hint domain-containing protein [Flindersiella endophytica]